MTILFALFLIPIYLSLIFFSRILKRKFQELFKQRGYTTVLCTLTMSNFKGIYDLFMADFKDNRAKDV